MNAGQSVWLPVSNISSRFISNVIDEFNRINLVIGVNANDLLPLPCHASMYPYSGLETATAYITEHVTLSEEFHALLKESLWLIDLLQVLYVTLYA